MANDNQYRVPDYMEGARFIEPDETRKTFPRSIDEYRLTDQAIKRLNELRGIFNAGAIEATIEHGHMVPGANNTMVFSTECNGVVLYVIALHKDDDRFQQGTCPIKTIWAHVHNRGLAWSLGWDTDHLDTIESLTPDEVF